MVNPVEPVRKGIGAVDAWQRRHRWAGVPYAVIKKFGDDNANLVVVALAWYGFLAIFPLLLVVVTIFGLIGQASLGHTVLHTLQEFPIVGSNFQPGKDTRLNSGNAIGLAVGLVGLIYGSQGVTQTAQMAMATVWNIPQVQRTGFLPRLGRSIAGLIIIGLAFLVNAFVTTYATGGTSNYAIRIPVLAGLLILNCALYFATFTLLTAKAVGPRGHLPGAILGGVVFTALITVGTGLVTHQLKNASNTYGTFGTVIGIVAFLLLLAKLSLYAAELNPVLARGLYPLALPMSKEPTEADYEVLTYIVRAEQRRKDQVIGVGYGEHAAEDAAADARRAAPQPDGTSPATRALDSVISLAGEAGHEAGHSSRLSPHRLQGPLSGLRVPHEVHADERPHGRMGRRQHLSRHRRGGLVREPPVLHRQVARGRHRRPGRAVPPALRRQPRRQQ
jgi:uncharacterized BrkB/YihY/UPF0761 family membrane protein